MRVAAASGDGVEPPVGNEGAAHESSTRTLMCSKQQSLERLLQHQQRKIASIRRLSPASLFELHLCDHQTPLGVSSHASLSLHPASDRAAFAARCAECSEYPGMRDRLSSARRRACRWALSPGPHDNRIERRKPCAGYRTTTGCLWNDDFVPFRRTLALVPPRIFLFLLCAVRALS